ncbi:MAG: hotdog fold thioesterase [Acidimicrobiia bacterium]|nr:hotdog fold thioesterase [Acidimicrobiia bacterium]
MTATTDRIVTLFSDDRYTHLIGLRLVATDPVTVGLEIGKDHLNFHGGTHGGALFSLADCAFSLAANAPGDPAVAVDTHLAFTAAVATGDRVTAVATEVARGRTMATYQVLLTRGDGRVCGLFTGTVYIIPAQS